jgi:hypothetical protein
MGVVYRFAQSEGLIPLGEQYNPVAYVIGIPSVSDYEAIALTPEEALKVLEQLQQPEYTMMVLVAATGIRAANCLACVGLTSYGGGLKSKSDRPSSTGIFSRAQKPSCRNPLSRCTQFLRNCLRTGVLKPSMRLTRTTCLLHRDSAALNPEPGQWLLRTTCNQQRLGRAFLRSKMENLHRRRVRQAIRVSHLPAFAHIMAHSEWREPPDRPGHAAMDKLQYARPLCARL